MPIPGSLIERLSEQLSRQLGLPVDVEQAVQLDGDSINRTYRLDTNAGRYVVKVNRADRHPTLFEAEADGLRRLAATGTVRVPAVVGFGEDHDDIFLLLEHVPESPRDVPFWERLGQQVAALHRCPAPSFGYDRDNHIGPLLQVNTPTSDWPSFLVRHRLEPLVRMAYDRRRLERSTVLRFERLYGRLPDLFPPRGAGAPAWRPLVRECAQRTGWCTRAHRPGRIPRAPRDGPGDGEALRGHA